MDGALLRVAGLQASYGQSDVLHGIDFAVEPHEIVCLLGSNGAGKTTTIRTITGQLRPRAGQVVFRGQDMTGRPPPAIVAAGMATVPEGRCIFPSLSVRDNLRLGAYSRRRDFQAEQELEAAYQMFPRLRERQDQPGGTLSGGEQQMLAIARALMAKPSLLLLDEPSMGLAPILVETVFETIAGLADAGMTVLLVEQNAEAALAVSSRAYVMERGRIVLSGGAEELRNNDEVRSAYLGAGLV